MPRLRRPEGYLMVDNRASGGALLESATTTCSHCQRVVLLNPLRTRERHHCFKCDHYICDNPTCHFECVPIQQVFDDLKEQAIKGAIYG